jgi:hypothetical protein
MNTLTDPCAPITILHHCLILEVKGFLLTVIKDNGILKLNSHSFNLLFKLYYNILHVQYTWITFRSKRQYNSETSYNKLYQWRKKRKVHHRIQNSSPPVPIPSHSKPIHPPARLPYIHFDPILLSTPWSSERSLYLGLSHPNAVCFSLVSNACHMPCALKSP